MGSDDPGGSANLYRMFLGVLSAFGLGHPSWAPWVFGILCALAVVFGAMPLFSGVAGLLRLIGRQLRARRDPRRVRRRMRFADHIESQLRRLDEKEEWRDHRFARLEAEVETEGVQRRRIRWLRRRQQGSLRREKSLSKALRRTEERLILLQGEPGAGKSVALRNAARVLAARAMRRKSLDLRIPLYVNLKELRPDGNVDADVIRTYVLAQLNRANSRDVEQFLADEFDEGMREAGWLFLFDAFDEIPAILTAVVADDVVERYADALFGFLHGMNRSCGVIASREFKGPRRFGWTRFIVQRLTMSQKIELVRKAELDRDAEMELLQHLGSAEPMVVELTGNPMLLGLLCDHVRETGTFPQSSHAVFETFVDSRLRRDESRLRQRFGVNSDDLRRIAEAIAFEMTASPVLGLNAGLSPTRSDVSRLVGATDRPLDGYLDALEYVKLALPSEVGSDSFTFAHRRFQEYFATCVVLREPNRVSVRDLLRDGRWRETAVAMLQTQTGAIVTELIAAAVAHLDQPADTAEGFSWPRGSLYVLSILDAGIAGRPDDLPIVARLAVGSLLRAAWDSNRRHYCKWSVQLSSLADADTQTIC